MVAGSSRTSSNVLIRLSLLPTRSKRSFSAPSYSTPAPVGTSKSEIRSAKDYCTGLLQYISDLKRNATSVSSTDEVKEVRCTISYPVGFRPSIVPDRLPRPSSLQC